MQWVHCSEVNLEHNYLTYLLFLCAHAIEVIELRIPLA